MRDSDSFFTVVNYRPPSIMVDYNDSSELLEFINNHAGLRCLSSEKYKFFSLLLANRFHPVGQLNSMGLKRQISRYVYEF